MSRRRFAYLGVVVLTVLLGMATSRGFEWLLTRYADDFPVMGTSLSSVLGLVLAIVVGAAVMLHAPTMNAANEVVDELTRVSWPTREETGQATLVVIIATGITAVYLGVLDASWKAITDWVLTVGRSG